MTEPGHRNIAADVLQGLLLFSGLVTLCLFLYEAREVLTPFVTAALAAYLLNPAVAFLEARGVRRDVAVILLFAALAAVAVVAVLWGYAAFGQDLPTLRFRWPQYMEGLSRSAARAREAVFRAWPWLDRDLVEKWIEGATGWVQGHTGGGSVVVSAARAGANALLVPFVAFFFLRGGSAGVQRVLDLCPGRWVEKFLALLYKMDEVLGGYFRGVTLEAVLVGLLSIGGLAALGVDYAALIGALSGVANLIPYFGPVVGGILGVGVAFAQHGTLGAPLAVAALFYGIHMVDSWVLQPWIMRRTVNVGPVGLIFALVAGGALAGIWGLLLAVPVAAFIKESASILTQWYLAERGLTPAPRALLNLAAKPWVV
jgi:predicted PurR-regulated permease PerM